MIPFPKIEHDLPGIPVLIHPHSTFPRYVFIYFVQCIICYLYMWFLYHCNMLTSYLHMQTTDFRYNLFFLSFIWYPYNLHGCNFWTNDWQKIKPCCRSLLLSHKPPLVHFAIGHFSLCFHPTSAYWLPAPASACWSWCKKSKRSPKKIAMYES